MVGLKRCSKCHEVKQHTEFGAHSRDGIRSRCKTCVRADKAFYGKGDVKAQRQRHYSRHRESIVERAHAWQNNHRDEWLQYMKSRNQRESADLSNSYVVHRLVDRTNIPAKDVPQVLVDVYREFLRVSRQIKGVKHVEC